MRDDAWNAHQFLADYYGEDDADPDLAVLLRRSSPRNDAELAELIEYDGRQRIGRGLAVTLERYFDAIPDLAHRGDPLDAALDITLRSMSRSGRVDLASVEALIDQYPRLEVPIREAAALTNALWSTARLQEQVGLSSPRSLPQDFGPPIESGAARYELRRLLGSGAFGEVYLAVDRQLSEDDHHALVAIKVLSMRDRSRWSRQRLLEEATKARRVDHPNVVRVLDRGVSVQDEDFIVYEVVEGGDLADWLRNRDGPVPIDEAVRVLAAIARGVQAAHAAGLVHCDLKPGNIMLTADGTPKVADFGVAIRTGEAAPNAAGASSNHHPVGNLAYISPEQYRMDEGALNVPSDVYALGGMLFTLLTGRLPNGSTLEEIAQVHHPEHGRATPPLLLPGRPEIDRDLEAICQRAMAIRAENRYSSAGALADDLDAWLRREPLYWTKPSAWRVLSLWCRRKPGLAMLSALLVVSVVTGGILAFHFSREAALADAQREIEQVRADEQARRNEAVRAKFTELASSMRAMSDESRAVMDMFPAAWAMEYILKRHGLATDGTGQLIKDVRIIAVRKLIDDAEAQGRGTDLETSIWRATLAYLLIARRELEAESLLESVRQRWYEILNSDDLLLGHLEALSAAAVVNRYLHLVTGGEITRNDATASEELLEARATLLSWEAYCRENNLAPAIRRLMHERMIDLFSPALFDDAATLAEIERLAYELREYDALGRTSSE